MHIQPIDNATDLEPFIMDVPTERGRESAAGEGNTFDDVWGSEPSSPTALEGRTTAQEAATAHPSDIRRLRAEHNTAGYREGVTAAKAQSMQMGFDEGFSLGAAIGSKAGQLLGILEGIAHALANQQPGGSEAAAMLEEARGELKMDRIFSPQFWNEDGTWKYEVRSPEPTSGGGGGGGGGGGADSEVVFADVADAHPLIVKWSRAVEMEMGRWGIDRSIFSEAGESDRLASHERLPVAAATTTTPTKKPILDW